MAGCLVIYSGGRNNHIYRHAGRLLRMALDELLPLAEMWEVPLAIEPMHPACATDWTFLTSLESAIDLVEQVDSPFLKIAYDTYHFPLGSRRRHLLASSGAAPRDRFSGRPPAAGQLRNRSGARSATAGCRWWKSSRRCRTPAIPVRTM